MEQVQRQRLDHVVSVLVVNGYPAIDDQVVSDIIARATVYQKCSARSLIHDVARNI